MQEFRVMRKRVDEIAAIVAQAPVRLVFGTAGEATLILLPLSWEDAVAETYSGPPIQVQRMGLTEAFAVKLLKGQTDWNWQPKDHAVLVLVGGEKLGWIVPDNEYWRGQTCPHQQVDGCCGYPDAATPECHEDVCPMVQGEVGE